MGRLIKPNIDRIFSTKITQLIQDLNKRAIVNAIIETEIPCTNCFYDGVNRCSSGNYRPGGPTPFQRTCPVCNNVGKIKNEVRKTIECTVKFGKGNRPTEPLPEGELPKGSARIKALVRYHNTLVAATAFEIDSVRYSPIGPPNKRGLQTYAVSEIYVKLDK